jgi:hypothetical protein
MKNERGQRFLLLIRIDSLLVMNEIWQGLGGRLIEVCHPELQSSAMSYRK